LQGAPGLPGGGVSDFRNENGTLTIEMTDGTTFEAFLGSSGGGSGAPGEDGVSVDYAEIVANGHLILTLSDGRTLDAGVAKGADGAPGTAGPKGDTGATSTVAGPQGPKGDTGTAGANGQGVPTGGTAGQILSKVDATAYNTAWIAAPAATNGLPTGGTTGQFLTKSGATAYAAGWTTAYTVPTGGTTGQVLTKSSATNGAVSWTTPAAGGGSTITGTNGNLVVKNATGGATAANLLVHADTGNLQIATDSPLVVGKFNFVRAMPAAHMLWEEAGNKPLAVHPAFATYRTWTPNGHGDTGSFGMPVVTTGNLSSPLLSNADYMHQAQLVLSTNAGANTVASWRAAQPVGFGWGAESPGVHMVTRFRLPAIAEGQSWFVGMMSSATVPASGKISDTTGFYAGYGMEPGDTTVHEFMMRGTTPDRWNISKDKALDGGFCHVSLYILPGNNLVKYKLRYNKEDFGGELYVDTQMPLYPVAFVGSGTTSTAASISITGSTTELIYQNWN
jgi:hypothetical protein